MVSLRSRMALTAADLRRHAPAATVPLLVRVATRAERRSARVMERARANMRFLLDEARPGSDIEGLAAAYVEHRRWRTETRWHPERYGDPVPVHGVEDVAGLDGALVTFVHHGPFELVGTSLGAHGLPVSVMANQTLMVEDAQPWLRQVVVNANRGCEVFSSAEGSAGVRRRLREGRLVLSALDVPGRTPTDFVGRHLVGSSGAVRIAHQIDAPVVPMTARRDEDGSAYFQLGAPLRPPDFADPTELLTALLSRHEGPVLDWPEAYDDPLSKWVVPERETAGTRL